MLRQPVHLIYGLVEDAGTASIAGDTAVEEIRYKDLVAIVRAVEAGGDDRGGVEGWSKEQLQHWLMDHQHTNIALFQHHTVLPLRFGTMVGPREEVQDFLVASYLQIKSILARVRGKAEFVVQLFWDLQAVVQEICLEEQGLEALKDAIDPADRAVIGRLLVEAAESKKRYLVEVVHRQLSTVSLDVSEAKLTDDAMIMNRSYLIERTAEAAFDAAMAAVGSEQQSYLRVKYVGPLPPYSFVPLTFRMGNFPLIDRARKTLSLPAWARLRDIKAAYRHLALHYHPDRNPDEPAAAARFRQVAAAYELLETYCLSCGEPAENTVYSFTPDEVHKVFVIRAKQGG